MRGSERGRVPPPRPRMDETSALIFAFLSLLGPGQPVHEIVKPHCRSAAPPRVHESAEAGGSAREE